MLKVNMAVFKQAFGFQITEQSDEISEFVNGHGFRASNGWKFRIDRGPELKIGSKTIYLRGYDNTIDLRVHRAQNLAQRDVNRLVREIQDACEELVEAADYHKRYCRSPRPGFFSRNRKGCHKVADIEGKGIYITIN